MDVVRNPIHATGVGLLLYGTRTAVAARRARAVGGEAGDVVGTHEGWFQDNSGCFEKWKGFEFQGNLKPEYFKRRRRRFDV